MDPEALERLRDQLNEPSWTREGPHSPGEETIRDVLDELIAELVDDARTSEIGRLRLLVRASTSFRLGFEDTGDDRPARPYVTVHRIFNARYTWEVAIVTEDGIQDPIRFNEQDAAILAGLALLRSMRELPTRETSGAAFRVTDEIEASRLRGATPTGSTSDG